MISEKQTVKGYSEEHKTKKYEEITDSYEGITVSGRLKVDWKRIFKGVGIHHCDRDCFSCRNQEVCNNCVNSPKMNGFHCEVARACEKCLEKLSQKTIYFVEINN